MRYFIGLLMIMLAWSCEDEKITKLKQGEYRGLLTLQDDELLPFNFKVLDNDQIEIYNNDEVILVDEIIYSNDSIRINFPVFEGYIAGKFENGEIIDGQYIKESLERYVLFEAEYNVTDRFNEPDPYANNVAGEWEMLFTEDDGSTFIGKGIFEQNDGIVTGTIRTTTGDYRYLEGSMDGEMMRISAFDGAHAFLFTAVVDGEQMDGYFYSGNHYKASFTATLNPDFSLPDENTLTYLKEGYDKFEFSFPDEQGNAVSLDDEVFKDKVVIVQIMGTWCPNCLDESKFYAQYARDNVDKDVQFVALAFEYAKTEKSAFAGIKRLKDRLNINYPILLAQTGSSDKGLAQEKLPMLNHVLSYPTTVFIDKTGEVRKIHTGFNGPATGEKYLSFIKEFDDFVNLLLNE